MDKLARRQEYDKHVLRTMIGMYCKAHHSSDDMCDHCSELLKYACTRVDLCPLGNEKVTCTKCKIHCYDKGHREQIRQVMRYSGPRLIFCHPVMALRHLLKDKL